MAPPLGLGRWFYGNVRGCVLDKSGLKCLLASVERHGMGRKKYKLRTQEGVPGWKKVLSDQHAIDSRSMGLGETLRETTWLTATCNSEN